MFGIFSQSLWRDEAFSALIAVKQPAEIISAMTLDQSPPLYFLLLHYWIQLFGTGEVGMRLLSLLFFLLLGGVMYLLSGEYIKHQIGRIIVVLAVLLNPLLFQYAAEARPYSMYAFFSTLAVYLILKKYYFPSGVVLGLSMLTHNFGWLNLIAIGLWWLYEKKETTFHYKNLRDSVSVFLPAFVMGGIWSIVTFTQLTRINSDFWITENSTAMFTLLLESFTRGEIWHKGVSAVYLFSLIIIVFGVSYFIAKKEKKFDHVATLAGFLSIIPIILTYFFSHYKTPIYHDRYLIASLPMVIIVISYGISKLWEEGRVNKILLGIILAAYLYSTYISTSQIANLQTKTPINWHVSQLMKEVRPGDSIVTEDVINFLEVKWYSKISGKNVPTFTYAENGEVPYFIGIAAFDEEEVLSATPSSKSVWIIGKDGSPHLP